ncbi:MAG: 3-isopropylmalate dehydratase large subunit [Candidatus Atribacteria bacterium]|nr:3-isopropylmalate dehydratase large subunit [Candidatus Atribacteria bacterium]
MGNNIVEKILQAHTDATNFKIGDIINVKVDFAFCNDITAPLAIEFFEECQAKDVFDKARVGIIPDHFTPNKDIKSAEQSKILKEFACKYQIENYFEVGRMGIEHALLPEKGLVLPGDLAVGADSHTDTSGALGAVAIGVGSTDLGYAMALGEIWLKVPPVIKFNYYGKLNKWVSGKDLILYTISKISVNGANYKVMEFGGETIKNLSMDSRFTMCNMAIEAGAKTGIIEPDEKTLQYVESRTKRPYTVYRSDPDANYEKIIDLDVSNIEPQIALPHSPDNVQSISEIEEIKIDQAVIGSCTNGRIEDLRIAAEVLKGHKIHPEVRLIVFPATQDIYQQAIQEGLINIFITAGAAVSTPTCGPCLGGHMGVLAKGERAISTTNRNFIGRMGHPESEVYLANPAVTAASALLGKIAHPEEVK